MLVTTQTPYYAASVMSASQKKRLALKAASSQRSITSLAEQHQVSRKFIRQQKHKMTTAIDEAFDNAANNDDVLYYLPVTKHWPDLKSGSFSCQQRRIAS